jgi:hypothetical protein
MQRSKFTWGAICCTYALKSFLCSTEAAAPAVQRPTKFSQEIPAVVEGLFIAWDILLHVHLLEREDSTQIPTSVLLRNNI